MKTADFVRCLQRRYRLESDAQEQQQQLVDQAGTAAPRPSRVLVATFLDSIQLSGMVDKVLRRGQVRGGDRKEKEKNKTTIVMMTLV